MKMIPVKYTENLYVASYWRVHVQVAVSIYNMTLSSLSTIYCAFIVTTNLSKQSQQQ